MPLQFPEGGVEPGHAIGERGGIIRHLDDFMPADAEIGEHAVRKDFQQLLRAAAVPIFAGELLDVDVEGFGQTQQDAGGDRPLIAFKMIEIAGRDAEFSGHGGLLQRTFAPKPLQSSTEE